MCLTPLLETLIFKVFPKVSDTLGIYQKYKCEKPQEKILEALKMYLTAWSDYVSDTLIENFKIFKVLA